MGNSAYQNVNRLANPTNDSEAMSAILKSASFDVVELKRDLKANEMRRTLRDFSDRVRNADIAIVYFAGHGIEIDGMNYVIPVDAVLERDIDAFDEAIPLDRLLTVIEPAKKLRLVILDACRDNPFGKTMKRTIASRAVGRGLAKVEPTSPNTLIAFAAKAGSTASDGDSKYSPFTTALVKYLTRPGLDLRKAFGFARDDVLEATNNKQEPFIYGSLGGDDFALVPAAPTSPTATNSTDPSAGVRRDYEFAERVGTREAWDFFLSTYPEGFYAKLAQAQHNKIAAEEIRVAATEKARLAVEERARLAAEGAKESEQAKAASQVKAAEKARMAAEQKKAIEDAKVAEAERARAMARERETEVAKLAAQKINAAEEKAAPQERIGSEDKSLEVARSAEAAQIAAEKQKLIEVAKTAESERAKAAAQSTAAADSKTSDEDKSVRRLAELTPPDQPGEMTPKNNRPSTTDLPRLLQTELRRVGCKTGNIDGSWNAAAQKSLALFNRNAETKFDVKVASFDALDAVRSKPSRVCPLICERGYKADRDSCTKIVCKAGYELGDYNNCKRIEVEQPSKPVANRVEPAASTSPSVVSGAKTSSAQHQYGTDTAGSFAKCREISMRAGWTGADASRYCGRRYSQ